MHQVRSTAAARLRRRLLARLLTAGSAALGFVPVSAAVAAGSTPPTSALSVTQSTLTAVSCPSATSCVAVGYYTTSTGTQETFANAWDGAKWTLEQTPDPASGFASQLTSVSCSQTNNCTAVGYSCTTSNEPSCRSTGGTQQLLVEHWNGTAWAIEPTTPPAGAISPVLSGVSCPTATFCTAVGSYELPASGKVVDQYTLAYRWNGSTWTRESTPNRPSDRTVSYFSAVSCASVTFCLAVGDSARLTLAEFWNGSKWLLNKTPNPSAGSDKTLSAVSCNSSTSCMAVGTSAYFYDGGVDTYQVSDHWNGKTWAATSLAYDTDYRIMGGVSCTSAKNCVEVGTDEQGAPFGFAEGWNGTTWDGSLGQPSPFPAFNGVSCAQASSCMVVGNEIANGQTGAGAQLWNGKTWLLENPVDP